MGLHLKDALAAHEELELVGERDQIHTACCGDSYGSDNGAACVTDPKSTEPPQDGQPPEAAAVAAAAAAAAAVAAAAPSPAAESSGGAGPWESLLRPSPLFRRFFWPNASKAGPCAANPGVETPEATPNTAAEEEEEEEGEEGEGDGSGRGPPPHSRTPAEVWGEVRDALSGGAAAIPALGTALRRASAALEAEMLRSREAAGLEPPGAGAGAAEPGGGGGGGGGGSSGSGASEATGRGGGSAGGGAEPYPHGLPPHARFAAGQLPLLRAALDLEPPRWRGRRALGTHRLWAADATALLLLARHPLLDAAVHTARLLPRVVALALSVDAAGALQARAAQALRFAVSSPLEALWLGLLTPGLGAGLPMPEPAGRGAGCGCGGSRSSEGSGSSGSFAGDDPEPGLCPPLHEAIAAIADSAACEPAGSRPSRTGFAVRAAEVLLAASDPFARGPGAARGGALDAALSGSEPWLWSVEPGGGLHLLLVEQEGELCGPRPLAFRSLSDEEGSSGSDDDSGGGGGGGGGGEARLSSGSGGGSGGGGGGGAGRSGDGGGAVPVSDEQLLRVLQGLGGLGSDVGCGGGGS
ncbi:hypothetical protein Rsub_01676 [Raphidocelis subcapitata]|uniref:Uncharacterized protein n=1 Tax=Raphidocelis subcapitata TaxID=307507 RepID=A0A2V0NVC9_9CHLO|nr:hypothetical protein Rsub_01676 [Raphidocelis subcapitata]|eukprot:GBF88775.1 hypothetical protein Rsub_01676 [Raphidocelis subcapitata]